MFSIGSIWAQAYMAQKIFLRSIRIRLKGYKKYSGSAEEIIRQVIESCWQKNHFVASGTGHFHMFWMRDFSLSSEALIKLGYGQQVKRTLEYALKTFKRDRRVSTAIIWDKAVDLPTFAVDSLPYLMHALRVLGDRGLVKRYKTFLEKQAKIYWRKVWDEKKGTLRKDFHFAAARDMVKRIASCYDTCMVGMLDLEMKKLGLASPVKVDVKKVLLEKYWNGSYFWDDLSGLKHVTADAQIFPFWTGVIEVESRLKGGSASKSGCEMLKKCINSIRKNKLDQPFPLKYQKRHFASLERWQARLFTPNYQDTTIWTQIGPLYISLVQKIYPKLAKTYIEQYKKIVEENKNFLEVFSPDGTPFQTAFYFADESMLWSAIFLDLLRGRPQPRFETGCRRRHRG